MTTQIFIQKENEELIYDNDQLQEFSQIVEELGLKCNNVQDKEKSPIPYMWIDEATVRAFKLLCPNTHKIADYDLEIPLEVLRQVKLSKTEKYFDWIEIWSNRKDPDPFCIGRVYKDETDRKNKYDWNAQYYLIGRWGAENKEVKELIDEAIQIAKQRIESYASSVTAKMKSWLECPEVWAREYIMNNQSEAKKAFNGEAYNLPF